MNETKIDFLQIIFFVIALPVLLFLKKPETGSYVNNLPIRGELPWPLSHGEDRPKLLTFGMYVTPDPENNPIMPPERFTGYHTALDIEIIEEEVGKVVPVYTICEGLIAYTGIVEGYGGVIIQACTIQNQEVRVLYGHLDYKSFQVTTNSKPVKTDTIIAELGDQHSAESGHTRKHLHLGIHKGPDIEFAGYVQSAAELDEFIDPLPLFE